MSSILEWSARRYGGDGPDVELSLETRHAVLAAPRASRQNLSISAEEMAADLADFRDRGGGLAVPANARNLAT